MSSENLTSRPLYLVVDVRDILEALPEQYVWSVVVELFAQSLDALGYTDASLFIDGVPRVRPDGILPHSRTSRDVEALQLYFTSIFVGLCAKLQSIGMNKLMRPDTNEIDYLLHSLQPHGRMVLKRFDY